MKADYKKPIMIAGPCSVENYEMMDKTAQFLKRIGVNYIRGGVFKPRTSPNSFQGLGVSGLEILKQIKKDYGLLVVSEILDIRDLEKCLDVVDVIQIGSRNMYNYPLLKEVGKTNKTVILKRGMSATYDEWINASEYIKMGGNEDIILCERGIRTFEPSTRNTLDLSCIPLIKQKTNLRIIVDPSHGTGIRDIVEPMSMAAIAAGADGLIIETHPEPDRAISDGFQSVDFETFEKIYFKTLKLYKTMKDL
ncbi:MAG TPA: 3-deoxy-7-phosphoheptulonate synthase [Clostridiaceae bacterium]|jgi:3-deoxy-7-phosphoheptulonate synthase|nr:3-deoxy-7-phosphoheptulonate synthase [Clostridiaceae bacterium]HBF77639.1 3-deoxy-7-phosphoheptulonate synthase [Clostridiaceae bacterium]HBN28468.1 3-deoxy-7-phosphoheptulonate synthase [Clostridiaceae bacterium]HBX49192.1 3-deoxy-7-phosphoheptulonate synthase [Clostridiaceae bacterium]